MLNRDHAAELIQAALGPQRLIWIGYHGLDAAPLLSLPQFSHCYSYGVAAGDDRIDHVFDRSVTEDGHSLDSGVAAVVEGHAQRPVARSAPAPAAP